MTLYVISETGRRPLKKKQREGNKNAARLLTTEKATQEISAVGEQQKRDVSTVTMKEAEEIGALTTSLEQAVKEFDVLKEDTAASAWKSEDL